MFQRGYKEKSKFASKTTMHEKELESCFVPKSIILGKRNEKSSIDGNDDLVSFLTYITMSLQFLIIELDSGVLIDWMSIPLIAGKFNVVF